MPFASFIIPTIGRPSIELAIESLQKQTDGDWDGVIVCDGFERTYEGPSPDERRLRWVGGEDYGSAGVARNVALSMVEGDWICFLDDDDRLEPTYVEHLRQHAEDYPWAKVIVFRMKHPYLGVLPRPDGRLAWGHVGISYAVARDAIAGHEFGREEIAKGNHEDWNMLEELLTRYRAFVSPHIDYVVRDA
jgi:glycosyltransferase involved in cell wall biosynthesis